MMPKDQAIVSDLRSPQGQLITCNKMSDNNGEGRRSGRLGNGGGPMASSSSSMLTARHDPERRRQPQDGAGAPAADARAETTRRPKKNEPAPPRWWKLWTFLGVLGLDALVLVLMALLRVFPSIEHAAGVTPRHTIHGSLCDLAFLAAARILAALFSVVVGYLQREAPPETPFDQYDKFGRKKSKEDLENEALEEPFLPALKRYVFRASFLCEMTVLLTGILLSAKSLARLNVEIGIYGESQPQHPVFWSALGLTALFSLVETVYMESIEKLAGELGRQRRREVGETWVDQLSTPLLMSRTSSALTDIEEGSAQQESTTGRSDDRVRPSAVSDIAADAAHSATWRDLLIICEPDKGIIAIALLFLILSSLCQILVPKFTGAVLDSLVDHIHDKSNSTSLYFSDDEGHHGQGSIVHIPGFVKNIELLVSAAILGGIFGGLRGSIFTLVGARVNARLRIRLMDSLLSQDIGFFDVTRTGDISSRLGSDTTLVGMSVTTCVNVFLRSAIMAVGYLIFMATISWQLSMLSFVTIPAVTVLSKWYGRYLRRLSRLQQKKLAEGNSVSESALSSMPTVRAFGAESVELLEFERSMQDFLRLNIKSAVATLGYTTCLNSLPELVKALVLFYGGLLVQSTGKGRISGGELISFILYLSALSGAFNSLGGIYAMLVRAVGAADKVFELLYRESQMPSPGAIDQDRLDSALQNEGGAHRVLGVVSTKVIEHRAKGLYPDKCSGGIVFRNVSSRYPARPERTVLDGLNLTIPAGSICALVGTSGSGKSSIVKLIQKLYTPTSGEVFIDQIPVSDLSLDWLSRNVAVVQQEPTLFARSVKKNIIYGLEGSDDEPSHEDIEEAARLANAAGFIEALPQGYDTEVGERGIRISGGQKQRIAIARALVRRPKVLLLDEATSALDSESEHVVQEAIDDMINGQRSLDGDPSRSMTVVIIAHRLSTVRSADSIFVIKDGNVAEQGTHEELLSNSDGVYSGLVSRQLGRIEVERNQEQETVKS